MSARWGPMRRRLRGLLLPGLALGAALGEPERPALAQPLADMGEAIDFDIPSQPLSAALVAFSRISGIQVLYDSQAAAGKVAPTVKGRMAGGLALRELLQGAGLEIRYAGRRSVTLVVPEAKDAGTGAMRLDTMKVEAAPVRIGGERFSGYVAQVLTDVRRALQQDGEAARVGYSVSVRLWLGPDGRVVRSQILKSTGDRQVDAELDRRLMAVIADAPPPAGLPQPLTYEFWTSRRP